MDRLQAFDGGMAFGLNTLRQKYPALEQVSTVVSMLGEPVMLGIILGLALLWLARRGDKRRLVVLLALVTTAVLLTVATKAVVQRERPSVPVEQPKTSSYPSDPALYTTAIYLGIALMIGPLTNTVVARRLKSVAVFVAFLVGMSQLWLGQHFFTDVIGGWAGGGMLALAAGALSDRSRQAMTEQN